MLEKEQLLEIAQSVEPPFFAYNGDQMRSQANMMLSAELPFGHTCRYAAKANHFPGVIKLFDEAGVHFDASSTYEVKHIVNQGVDPDKVSLSSQTTQGPLKEVIDLGILLDATSLDQMTDFIKLGRDEMSTRINAGLGSGHHAGTNVGGPNSPFGIYFKHLDQVLRIAEENGIEINKLHTHIGSGVDPKVWGKTMDLSLAVVEQLKDVKTLNIGGGYKIARLDSEVPTDMEEVFKVFSSRLVKFAERTGRELHLETEPGTLLVGNAGDLVARVEEVKETEPGKKQIILGAGMNVFLRGALYGARHKIEGLNYEDETEEDEFFGGNCEASDNWTPESGKPGTIEPMLVSKLKRKDLVVVRGMGAYCASMSAKGYNSFPDAKEILV